MKRKFCALYLLIVVPCLLCSGCNTVRGFGEDVSGSANFVEKKMCGEDAVPAASNPPQWPR